MVGVLELVRSDGGFGFEESRLYPSILDGDQEALELWTKVTGLPGDQVRFEVLSLEAPASCDTTHVFPLEVDVYNPENWFDLVIGNVPFGNYPVADTSTSPSVRNTYGMICQ